MLKSFPRFSRVGIVSGVSVLAYPVVWGRVRSILEAEAAHDDAAVLSGMAAAVAESVQFDDGTPIPVETLDVQTIGELFKFASGRDAANPTPSASPASGKADVVPFQIPSPPQM